MTDEQSHHLASAMLDCHLAPYMLHSPDTQNQKSLHRRSVQMGPVNKVLKLQHQPTPTPSRTGGESGLS